MEGKYYIVHTNDSLINIDLSISYLSVAVKSTWDCMEVIKTLPKNGLDTKKIIQYTEHTARNASLVLMKVSCEERNGKKPL